MGFKKVKRLRPDGHSALHSRCRTAALFKARDQVLRPANTRRVPGVANRKGPGVLVGSGVEARRRTLAGCSVAHAVD